MKSDLPQTFPQDVPIWVGLFKWIHGADAEGLEVINIHRGNG